MNGYELSGWIGSICFAFSALPQAIKCMREGHAFGVSWGMIILWTIGEWGSLIYVLPMMAIPLICNYVGNIVFCGIVTYYKLRPRKSVVEAERQRQLRIEHGVYS